MTGVEELGGGLAISDDSGLSSLPGGAAGVETPTSTLSTTGLGDGASSGSAFGSGSSVLSSFEPPNDGDFIGLAHQTAALTHLLEDPSAAETSLEELEAVISKLQAIYLYRQVRPMRTRSLGGWQDSCLGLKALAEERIAGPADGATAAPSLASFPVDLQAALLGATPAANAANAANAAAAAAAAAAASRTHTTHHHHHHSASCSGITGCNGAQQHHHIAALTGGFRAEMPCAAAVPGSPNSIWRMSVNDAPQQQLQQQQQPPPQQPQQQQHHQQQPQPQPQRQHPHQHQQQQQHQQHGGGGQFAPAASAAAAAAAAAAAGVVQPATAGDYASLAQLQFQLHQDMVRTRSGGSRNGRFPRRRTHRRQASSPAALRPPQWADPSWHPMTAVLAKGELAGAGTGVFIPAQAPGVDNKVPGIDAASVMTGSEF